MTRYERETRKIALAAVALVALQMGLLLWALESSRPKPQPMTFSEWVDEARNQDAYAREESAR